MRDYSNQKSCYNVPLKDDEVLVPILAEQLKWRTDLNKANFKTFPFGNRKVLVAFIPCKKDEFEKQEKNFQDHVDMYLAETRRKRCILHNRKGEPIRCPKTNSCVGCKLKDDPKVFNNYELSLDAFLDDMAEDGSYGFDPTATSSFEDDVITELKYESMIKELYAIDPEVAECIKLLRTVRNKSEVIAKLKLDSKKSQGYAFIKRCQTIAKEIWYRE